MNIKEIWMLYQRLRKGTSNKSEYLIDEVETILSGISNQDFLASMRLLYPKKDIESLNPIEMTTLFIRGLKQSTFFGFVDFIKGLTNGRTHR